MLRNEFIQKCNLSEAEGLAEYVGANAIYMSLPDDVCKNNDQFCAMYREARKNTGAMQIIDGLIKKIISLDRHIEILETALEDEKEKSDTLAVTAEQVRAGMEHEHGKEKHDLGVWAIETADHYCASDDIQIIIRNKAREILGEREYYKQLLLHGAPLREDVIQIAKLID